MAVVELNDQICGTCKPWILETLQTLLKKYETRLVSEYDLKSQELLCEVIEDIKQNFFVTPKPIEVNPLGIPRGNKSTEKIYDLCFVYSQETGSDVASKLSSLLNSMNIKTTLISCPPPATEASFDLDLAESVIAQSSRVVLVLSKDALKIPSLLFASLAAVTYTIRIFLVHDESGCTFPGSQEQPDFLVDANVFHDKAVTYLEQFVQTAADQLKKKLEKKQVEENIRTTAFLSHKRSSAQGIAGRIYQGESLCPLSLTWSGLSSDYRIFLDSEADFDLHDLQLIVKETGIFIFLLSEGIFQSRWCIEELRSAVQNHKRVIIIRNHTFHIPKKFPDHLKDIQEIFSRCPTIVYMAEFYTQCIQKLRELLGPSDQEIEQLEKYLDSEFSTILATHRDKKRQGLASIIPLKAKHISRQKQSASKLLSALLTRYNVDQIEDSVELENFHLEANTTQLLTRLNPSLQSLKLVKCTVNPEDFVELLKTPPLRSLSVIDCDPSILKNISTATGLTSLTVKSTAMNDAILPSIVQNCSNIQFLNLQECENLTSNSLKLIAAHLSSLEHLNIRGSESAPTIFVKDDGIQVLASRCKFLKSLNLGWCTGFTDSAIKSLVENCSQLEELNLDKIANISDVSIEAIAQGNCAQSLKILTLNSDLNNFGKITDKGITELSKCHNLKVLELNYRKALTDQVFAHIGSGCLHLEVLKIHGCNQLTDNAIKNLTENCKNLKNVVFSVCDKMTNEALIHLANSSPDLEIIDMQQSSVTDAGLSVLCEKCPLLKSVNASNCGITDAALEAIGKSKNLQSLWLVKYSSKITDKGLSFLNNLPQLEVLNLYGAQVTSQGIAKIAEGSHKLTTINLTYTEVGSEGIEALAKSNPNLVTLNLQECTKLTNSGLKALGQHCHFIQTLNLICAGTINDDGVAAIAEGCWQLASIEVEGTAVTDSSINKLKELKNIRNINAQCKGVSAKNKKITIE